VAEHIYQLIPSFNCAGQFAQSVWHWQFDDAGFATTKDAATALINAFDAGRRTVLRACLPTDTLLISYRARLRFAVGGFNAFVPVASTNAGTRPGTQSASALNPVVLQYPLNPAHGRGKWFVPGVSETDIQDGRFTTAFQSAMITNLGTLFDQLTLTGGGGPTATFGWFSLSGSAFRVATNSGLSLNLGIQRRRMRPAG
jgi:hypothetical protein